jgi:hypothetical protein
VLEKLAKGIEEEPLLIGVGLGHAVIDPQAVAPVLEDTRVEKVA